MFTVFNTLTINQEMVQEFHRFFSINNLTPLFTSEQLSSHISVSDNELRSIVTTGSKVKPFLDLASFLLENTHNKRYNDALLRIIDEPNSFTKFTTYVTRIVNLWYKEENENRKNNFWNAVFYDGVYSKPVIFY